MFTILLLRDGAMGLQIKPVAFEDFYASESPAQSDDEGWQDCVVPAEMPAGGAAIVNTGALMARWTNDEWRATAHRVVAGPPEVASKDRYSIAFFFDPDKESVIETHPACLARTGKDAKYASISAKDFVMMKIMEMQKTAAEAGVKAAY